MEILILQYALAALICMWWIKPFKVISFGKHVKISLFNLLCTGNLVFLGTYMLLREFSERNTPGNIYTALFLCINILLFLIIPAGYIHLRNQFEHKQTNKADLIHILPSALYVICFIVPWVIYGQEFLTSFGSASFFNVFVYCTIGIYILLIMKFLLKKYIPFLTSAKKTKYGPEAVATRKIDIINAENQEQPEPQQVQIGSVHLDKAQLDKMDETLRTFFLAQQPYLQQGYNLKQMADDTSIPLHHLSAFINQYYHIHFNDFINEYRVQYCQVKIKNDEWRSKTLEAIAEESGFNNRNTFTAAFKKVTGFNPSDYLRMVKQKQIA